MAAKYTFCLLLLSIYAYHCLPLESETIKCTYENCPQPDPKKINVHLISHTHDDVGWLKTVDQYYYGNLNNIQNAGVQYILDSVIDALQKNPSRRFIYVETAFFWRWWNEQSDSIRHTVQRLVREGRLEFIGGGWSMNDEAASHYNAIIDNMAWGLKVLNDTFGVCGKPKVAWQIDPFGHSREQASIFAQMGYDGLFFGRLDYRDKMTRQKLKTMEVVWQGSDNLGSKADLFTGVLPNLYQPPSGFCFDVLCNDAPIMDNLKLEDYNVPKKVLQFMRHVNHQTSWYKTNNIVMTMGNDFNYQDANTWFKNLDKLIYYVNKMHDNVNVFYSTPSCYLNALHKSNKSWEVKKQDFMPYASEPHAYWVGYFTSRPTFKRFIRYSNNFLQVCKQLDTLAQLGPIENSDVNVLRHAMAVAQHHDAVTGTAKQHVTNDYYKRLYKGIESCQVVVNNALKKLASVEEKKIVGTVHNFCNLLNISQCQFTEQNTEFSLTVYNPIAKQIDKFIRLPVVHKSYEVKNSKGEVIDSEVVPIAAEVFDIPGRESDAQEELIFRVKLPALGFTTYSIKKSSGFNPNTLKSIELGGQDFLISNEILNVNFDGNTGLVKSMSNKVDGSKSKINQLFYWYYGMNGNNRFVNARASGAYIFRPNGTHPNLVSNTAEVKVYSGSLVQEVHQKFNSWISQVIRLYKGEDNCEFEWLVGSIPVNDRIGKEIISRFDSDISSEDKFYTDSNGREILERIRDKRPDYKLSSGEPVAQNYYPVNSRIFIKDSTTQLTILTDRSQAGASLYSGSMELMLHRRLLHDDGFGVAEPLDERAFGRGLVARGIQYLQLSKIKNANVLQRNLGERLFMAPWLAFSSIRELPSNTQKTEYSALVKPLPPNVHLLTLEQWTKSSILLRLEHYFEKNDDPDSLSRPVKVSLKNMFTTFTVIGASEMSLDGVHLFTDMKRLKWKTTEETTPAVEEKTVTDIEDIVLKPMEIRTFLLKIK